MNTPPLLRQVAPDAGRIDARVINEAADWLTRLREDADSQTRAAFEIWREAALAHDIAWRRLSALSQDIDRGVAAAGMPLSTHTLKQTTLIRSRRNAIRLMLTGGSVAAGVWWARDPAMLPTWTADARTGTGEQRALTLADGTHVQMNSRSALDVRFIDTHRELVLHGGEVIITTGHDASNRPFFVSTRAGRLTPIGTRFIVRDVDTADRMVRLSVLEGVVEARSNLAGAPSVVVRAGQQIELTAAGLGGTRPLAPGADSWLNGMVLANEMPLGEFLLELGRYRAGVLRCSDEAADLRVVGAFALNDTDAALMLLQQVLPINVRYLTRYLVYVNRA